MRRSACPTAIPPIWNGSWPRRGAPAWTDAPASGRPEAHELEGGDGPGESLERQRADLIGLDDATRDEVLERYGEARLDPGAASLTVREKEILQLLAAGVSATDELAERLYISQKTVKNHLASIFQKLAVSDRTQAAIEAIRLGIARPN